jgi:hypothetical protein
LGAQTPIFRNSGRIPVGRVGHVPPCIRTLAIRLLDEILGTKTAECARLLADAVIEKVLRKFEPRDAVAAFDASLAAFANARSR